MIEFLQKNKLQILAEYDGFVDLVLLCQRADLFLSDHKMSIPFIDGNFFAYNAKRALSNFEISSSSAWRMARPLEVK